MQIQLCGSTKQRKYQEMQLILKLLAKDDFLMVIQTPFQREMFKKFAQKGICCDSTHGTNAYDFLLTTIHVINEFGERISVAWCLSNHEDFTTI